MKDEAVVVGLSPTSWETWSWWDLMLGDGPPSWWISTFYLYNSTTPDTRYPCIASPSSRQVRSRGWRIEQEDAGRDATIAEVEAIFSARRFDLGSWHRS